MEYLLHYLWSSRRYLTLRPCGGKVRCSVEVLHPGLPNRDAGPDFFNAKVRIDGVLWVGNVELHIRASDWQVHGHGQDAAYDNCILHVVQTYDKPALNTRGEEILTCEMVIAPTVMRHAREWMERTTFPMCADRLMHLEAMARHAWLDRLVAERLQRKADDIVHLYRSTGGEWSQTFYMLLCRYFGFRVNGDAMERMARSLPLRFLQKHRGSLLQLEAMLMGQAGLLSISDTQEDDYFCELRQEYDFLSHKFGLHPLPPSTVRLHRIRPTASPYRRIAQLASILHHTEWIADVCVQTRDPKLLYELLAPPVSDYWQHHTTPHHRVAETSGEHGRLGQEAFRLLLINVVAPYRYAYASERHSAHPALAAQELLEQLPPENNRFIRQFRAAGIHPTHAADSQALMQLADAYCLLKKCFRCRWGQVLLASSADKPHAL